ncbi:hypothetical protein ABPG74_007705 [Tetrahymena malaccensis]
MDCSNFVKKCQTHLNKNINFLQIYPESADYKLACQKCLSIIQSKSYIFDLQEVLNEENDILHYWPLSQQEKCFEEALQILQILDTDEYQQQISQKIKILRTKFDDQIFKLENKLQECNSDKIKQQFYLKYKQAAQMKQLVEYIKEELTQQNQEESTKQKFKQFIKQQIENNEIENLLQHLKENQQKQEINLNILSQITVSIEQIFQDPKLNKYAQDQAIKQNYEQNELQIKIESLMTQLEELKQKNEQELILKSEDIQNLTEKINLRTSQCDTSLKSSNIFSQNCETLSQNFKQKEEDLNNQAQKQDINTFHEKYFINLKSKQSISHIHELKLTRFQGGRNIYSQHTCQICKKKKLKFSWYCYQCSYDVCQSCIYKEEQNILQRANLQQQYKKDGKLLLSFFTKHIIQLALQFM